MYFFKRIKSKNSSSHLLNCSSCNLRMPVNVQEDYYVYNLIPADTYRFDASEGG